MPISEDVKKLVIARLKTMPPTIKISIGSTGTFSRDDIIDHIKKEDEIGHKIVEIHLFYLRSLTRQKG